MLFISPMQINLLAFKINTVDNASVTNAGSFQSIDEVISYKRNQAIGEINGDLSPLNVPVATIVDPDIADSNTIKNSAI